MVKNVNYGKTSKVDSSNPALRASFLKSHSATMILVSGEEAGKEWAHDGARAVVGREPKATIQLEAPSVSSEHAVFELGAEGYGIRDLASTNGVRVNRQDRLCCGLVHGDRIQLGEFELQYVDEDRVEPPKAWSVEEDEG